MPQCRSRDPTGHIRRQIGSLEPIVIRHSEDDRHAWHDPTQAIHRKLQREGSHRDNEILLPAPVLVAVESQELLPAFRRRKPVEIESLFIDLYGRRQLGSQGPAKTGEERRGCRRFRCQRVQDENASRPRRQLTAGGSGTGNRARHPCQGANKSPSRDQAHE